MSLTPEQSLGHAPIVWRPRSVVSRGQQARQEAQDKGLDFSEPSDPRGRLPSFVPLLSLSSILMILELLVGRWWMLRTLGRISPLHVPTLQNPPQYTSAKLRRAQVEKQPDQTQCEHSGWRAVLIDYETCHGQLEQHAHVDMDPD